MQIKQRVIRNIAIDFGNWKANYRQTHTFLGAVRVPSTSKRAIKPGLVAAIANSQFSSNCSPNSDALNFQNSITYNKKHTHTDMN